MERVRERTHREVEDARCASLETEIPPQGPQGGAHFLIGIERLEVAREQGRELELLDRKAGWRCGMCVTCAYSWGGVGVVSRVSVSLSVSRVRVVRHVTSQD